MKIQIITHLKRTITRADCVLISFLLLCTLFSFSLWFRAGSGKRVVVLVSGSVVRDLPLDTHRKEMTMQGFQGPFSFVIADGKVRMIDSACPDKVCVTMGWIEHEGQMICCVPNRAALRIVGQKERLDALAR